MALKTHINMDMDAAYTTILLREIVLVINNLCLLTWTLHQFSRIGKAKEELPTKIISKRIVAF
ncbi:hypothetical protein F5B18DRAFT_647698 [Nemania serpens]|nr:hypothetical protein F5B18DRAFT_647698 [Nemania serpens]